MKRRLLKVAVFLLLGALVNVTAIAALGFWGERPAQGTFESIDRWETQPATSTDIARWERWTRDGWPAAPDRIRIQTLFGMRYRMILATVNSFDPSQLSTAERQEKAKERNFFSVESANCGWPLTCMTVDQATETVGFPATVNMRRGGGQIGRLWIPNELSVLGMFVNTLFYATILWLLFAAPVALRRRRRIKRGLCPACAYPVGVSDVCTECGKPLPKRAGTAS